MPQIRIGDSSDLLSATDDTIRRWIDDGTLPASRDNAAPKIVHAPGGNS